MFCTNCRWFSVVAAMIVVFTAWYFSSQPFDILIRSDTDKGSEKHNTAPSRPGANRGQVLGASRTSQNEEEQMESNRSLDNVKLYRIDPIEVGYVRRLSLPSGGERTLKTLSVLPPVFEIENFLSDQECNDIIFMAETQGLERSRTFVESELDHLNYSLVEDPSAVFRRLDSNENGELDLLEVAAAFSLSQESLISVDDAKSVILDLDLDYDKNDVIGYTEFLSLYQNKTLQKLKSRLDAIVTKTSAKRNRHSSTAFLDPREHVDFVPLFDSIRQRQGVIMRAAVSEKVVLMHRCTPRTKGTVGLLDSKEE